MSEGPRSYWQKQTAPELHATDVCRAPSFSSVRNQLAYQHCKGMALTRFARALKNRTRKNEESGCEAALFSSVLRERAFST